MSLLLIGNAISFIGATIMVLVGFIKSREKILLAQIVQLVLMGIGNLVLGGITAVITNAVSIIRNLVCFKWQFTLPLKLFFTGLQIILALYSMYTGQNVMPAGSDPYHVIIWFPIIGTAMFTMCLDVKSDAVLKVVIVISQVFWLIYDLTIMNFASAIFDVLTIISTTIGVIMILRGKKKDDFEEEVASAEAI